VTAILRLSTLYTREYYILNDKLEQCVIVFMKLVHTRVDLLKLLIALSWTFKDYLNNIVITIH